MLPISMTTPVRCINFAISYDTEKTILGNLQSLIVLKQFRFWRKRSRLWCPEPDLDGCDLHGREIFDSFHGDRSQNNQPKHKSNAIPSCFKLLLDAVTLTHKCQHSFSEIPPEGDNCRSDCDGYRPDTLGGRV